MRSPRGPERPRRLWRQANLHQPQALLRVHAVKACIARAAAVHENAHAAACAQHGAAAQGGFHPALQQHAQAGGGRAFRLALPGAAGAHIQAGQPQP